jgi:hypothetical protein
MDDSSFDLSAAALAAADANLAEARRLREAADAGLAAAKTTLAAAVEAHRGLAAKLASGEAIKPADTVRAATTVRDSQEHLALAESAQKIAVAKEAEALDLQLRAAFSHSRFEIAAVNRLRAVRCSNLDKAATAFALAVTEWQSAGNDLISAKHHAAETRFARFGPPTQTGSSFDRSKVSTSRAAAALPAWILSAIISDRPTHVSMAAEAALAEREGAI